MDSYIEPILYSLKSCGVTLDMTMRFLAGCLGAWFNWVFVKTQAVGTRVFFRYCLQRKFYITNFVVAGGALALATTDGDDYKKAFLFGFGLTAFIQQVFGESQSADIEMVVNGIYNTAIFDGRKGIETDLQQLEDYYKDLRGGSGDASVQKS